MMKRARYFAWFTAAALVALAACKGDDGPPALAPNSAEASTGDHGCADDSRVTAFAAGLQAKSPSGRVVAEIVNATPSPPERGEGDAGMNTWTMKLTIDGQPPSADALAASTYMPDHGHRSPLIPKLAANGDGTYALTDLYLFMGGVWQISFAPAKDGGAPDLQDTATFSLCVE